MSKTEAFVSKVLGDTTGLTNTVLAWMGDELGLWKDLHARGPATSVELAERTRLAERPVREWFHYSKTGRTGEPARPVHLITPVRQSRFATSSSPRSSNFSFQ